MSDEMLHELAAGRVPDGWERLGRLAASQLQPPQLDQITTAIDAFVDLQVTRLQRVQAQLAGAEFAFDYPESIRLRRASDADRENLDAFKLRYGPIPLTLDRWYHAVGSFNFAQSGRQMFEPTPFYFFLRFLRFTSPPIDRALTCRWEDDVSEEQDDASPFFLVDEFHLDEDARGFNLPNDTIDPVVDSETGMRYLQWVDRQVQWGGYGTIQDCLDGIGPEEYAAALDVPRLRQIFS